MGVNQRSKRAKASCCWAGFAHATVIICCCDNHPNDTEATNFLPALARTPHLVDLKRLSKYKPNSLQLTFRCMLTNCRPNYLSLRTFTFQYLPSSLLIMPSQTRKSHFRTIQKFQIDYAPVSISQYVSERTGMHCVVVDQKGPKVQGYFALATEIFDDSGAPHTLEHLVFMGSKSYQYKGLLDKLATRAYSNTNAWTATDHTAYTLDTAGWEGFAQILPVYLEHVILPTLTDEGCYTEVHHIDGEGNDAGVVYSEMQGVENTGAEIMDIKARQLLYPENVGFRYETGGLMGALRVLTADRIRAFHKEMYQPKNLCLVLIGEVDQDHLLQILDEFEDGILDDIPRPDAPFKR